MDCSNGFTRQVMQKGHEYLGKVLSIYAHTKLVSPSWLLMLQTIAHSVDVVDHLSSLCCPDWPATCHFSAFTSQCWHCRWLSW